MADGWRWLRCGAFLSSREEYGGTPETLLSMSVANGVIPRDVEAGRAASEDLSGYRRVQPSDLVVNRLVARDGAFAVSRYEGSVSPAYWVLICDRRVAEPSYLHHAFRSKELLAEVWRRSKDMPPAQFDLPWQLFKTMPILLPPLATQRAIAEYLDRETARIDTLVREQQRLIEMLRERRAAVLSGVFEAGPSTKTTKVGRLLAARPSYGVLVPTYVDEAEGVPFVRVGDLMNLAPERPMLAISPEQSDEYSRTKVAGGEVLLGVVGKMGQAALAPRWLAGANVARAVAVLRCSDPAVAPLLCAWLGSNSFMHQANLATSGDSIQPTLGMKDLARFDISLPTDSKAAAHLAGRLAKIDALIAETERFIELVRERRSGLITAAVMGQIDVRVAA